MLLGKDSQVARLLIGLWAAPAQVQPRKELVVRKPEGRRVLCAPGRDWDASLLGLSRATAGLCLERDIQVLFLLGAWFFLMVLRKRFGCR